MKSHGPKSIPDRCLTGMIAQTLQMAEDQGLDITSQKIHNFISQNEFFFESPELDKYGKPFFSQKFTYDNLPGIRSELTYMRHMGYISKQGEGKTKTFVLTMEGKLLAADPFFKYRYKQQYTQNIIDERVKLLLSDDDYVNQLAEDKRIKLCKTCRLTHPKAKRLKARSWTARPNKGKIGAQMKDGSIVEIEVTDEGKIKELEELKAVLVRGADGKIDTVSTIMSLQNQNAEYVKMLNEAGIKIGDLDTQLNKAKGRKSKLGEKTLIRTMDRIQLANHYADNDLYLDIDFFEIWQGGLLVVEYKRLLQLDGLLSVDYDIQSKRSEIITRTDFTRRVLEPHEIQKVKIQITEIRDRSIVVDSKYFKAPKVIKIQ